MNKHATSRSIHGSPLRLEIEGGTSGSHGGIHIVNVGLLDLGNDLLGGRIVGREGAARFGINKLVVDKKLCFCFSH
jgi:hypothetical protein